MHVLAVSILLSAYIGAHLGYVGPAFDYSRHVESLMQPLSASAMQERRDSI